MKISILTYGSRGDIQPFLALAVGLRQAGHAATLAGPERFAALAREHQVDFASLPGDPQELSKALNTVGTNPLGQVRAMSDYVFSIAGQVARAAFAACAGADLIVHSFLFTTGGHSLARRQGIPDVSVQVFPMFAPTRAFPNVAAAGLPPGPLSVFSHWLATQIFWHGGNLGFRRLRKMEPDVFDLRLSWPFGGPAQRRTPLLFAYSPRVLPRPTDWNAANIHIPGYFFLPEARPYQPPARLENFLASGALPLCVTFGSMVSEREGARLQGLVLQAIEQSGKRAVVLTGWGGAQGQDTSQRLFLDSAPHSWLFPRCRAVIHHGGAGTTAAALRAGIPNLVLPHTADQPFWGQRVAELGVGPAPIAVGRVTARTLAAALLQMEQAEMRERAAELGRAIQAEDGVAQAVRLIETRDRDFRGFA